MKWIQNEDSPGVVGNNFGVARICRFSERELLFQVEIPSRRESVAVSELNEVLGVPSEVDDFLKGRQRETRRGRRSVREYAHAAASFYIVARNVC